MINDTNISNFYNKAQDLFRSSSGSLSLLNWRVHWDTNIQTSRAFEIKTKLALIEWHDTLSSTILFYAGLYDCCTWVTTIWSHVSVSRNIANKPQILQLLHTQGSPTCSRKQDGKGNITYKTSSVQVMPAHMTFTSNYRKFFNSLTKPILLSIICRDTDQLKYHRQC